MWDVFGSGEGRREFQKGSLEEGGLRKAPKCILFPVKLSEVKFREPYRHLWLLLESKKVKHQSRNFNIVNRIQENDLIGILSGTYSQ